MPDEDTPVDPAAPVTVRTTFQPSVDLQVSASEAMYLRRRGLLVPDAEEPQQSAQVAKKPAPPKPSADTADGSATTPKD
jgi:hypothetical protein